jgi:hypothetical protein
MHVHPIFPPGKALADSLTIGQLLKGSFAGETWSLFQHQADFLRTQLQSPESCWRSRHRSNRAGVVMMQDLLHTKKEFTNMPNDVSTFTSATSALNTWPDQNAPQQPSLFPQLTDLSDDELAAATAAVERLRLRKAEQEANRQRWQPVFDELATLEEEDGSYGMVARLIEMAELCGWNEDEDERLCSLVVALIEQLELDVKRNKRGEVSVRHWHGPVVRST